MWPQPTIARRTRSMIKAYLGRREAPTACSAHSQSRFNTTSTIVGSSVGQNLIGNVFRPRSVRLWRYSGSSVISSSRGSRRTSASMAICPSTRASGAPRQQWITQPKAMCRLSARVRSRRSGAESCAGARSAAPGDEGVEVVTDGVVGGGAAPRDVGIGKQPDRVEPPGDVEAPPLEALVVRDGNAQHLANDVDGDRVCELLDHVHRARGLGARDELVDDLLDARSKPLDDARGERLADETPQPRVVRRVAIQHRVPHPAWHFGAEAGGDERGERFLDKARIAQHRRHVLVAGEHPEAERTLMDGVFGAQAVVGRIRIRQELRVHRIEALHAVPALPSHFGGVAGGTAGTPGVGTTTPGASWISSTSVTFVT